MSTTTMLNQPFTGQLGDYLIDALQEKSYSSLTFAVAFAKNSGVLRLKESLGKFRSGGAKITAFVGVDLGGTSYEALTSLLGLVDELYVIHVESDQTFHSKVYSLKNETGGVLIVGSNNMTGGGLWTNFESCSVIDLSFNNTSDTAIQNQVEAFFLLLKNTEKSFSMRIAKQGDIDNLLSAKYVEKEVVTHIKRAKKKKSTSREPRSEVTHYFSKGFKTPIPKLNQKPATTTVLVEADPEDEKGIGGPKAKFIPISEDNYQVVWFETRAMTGGSANQLDISMKAAIESGDPSGTEFALNEPNMMKGGVQFFGVNPQHPDEKKDITINFNGIDYVGNTLLYYVDGARPNGSWRLQIKGIADDGTAFTSHVERGYLKKKVLAFSRVETDYYFMTVFPETDLEEFKEASTLVARNGTSRQARFFGLL